MKLILAHENADFDAVAAQWAAYLCFPDHKPLLSRRLNRNVRQFLAARPDAYDFGRVTARKRGPIEHLLLVDTQSVHGVRGLRPSTPVTVVDHHPLNKQRDGWVYEVEPVGAATTLFVEKLMARGEEVSAETATLLLLGIYEDTGTLTYGTTTDRDRIAAAYLLPAADLSMVERYLNLPMTAAQETLYQQLRGSAEWVNMEGQSILVAAAVADPKFDDELAPLAHRLRDEEKPVALFILIRFPDRIQLTSRSTNDIVDVSVIARQFKGGGHARAAAATIRKGSFDAAHAKLMRLLPKTLQPLGQNLLDQTQAPAEKALLAAISQTAGKLKTPVYLVGGSVRDMLLQRPSADIDMVVVGDALALIRRLAAQYGGSMKKHGHFGTGKWQLNAQAWSKIAPDTPLISSANSIDFVTARSETYSRPAALPTVRPAAIHHDLARRDFTLNTLAIRLDGDHRGRFIDRHNGYTDLQKGLIRVLHDGSFIDDPTRILRAVRFEQRFGFAIEPHTLALLQAALLGLKQVSGARLRNEIELILCERQPEQMLARLAELGILNAYVPDLTWPQTAAAAFSAVRTMQDNPIWQPLLAQTEMAPLLFVVWMACLPEKVRSLTLARLDVRNATRDDAQAAAQLHTALAALGEKAKPSFIEKTVRAHKDRPRALLAARAISAFPATLLLDGYQRSYRHTTTRTDGNTLRALGLPPGPAYKVILDALLAARLDGVVKDDSAETDLLQTLLKKG